MNRNYQWIFLMKNKKTWWWLGWLVVLKFTRYVELDCLLKFGHSFDFGESSFVFVQAWNGLFNFLIRHLIELNVRLWPIDVVFDRWHWYASSWTKSRVARTQNPLNTNENESEFCKIEICRQQKSIYLLGSSEPLRSLSSLGFDFL